MSVSTILENIFYLGKSTSYCEGQKLEFYAKNFLVDTINDKASLIFGGVCPVGLAGKKRKRSDSGIKSQKF